MVRIESIDDIEPDLDRISDPAVVKDPVMPIVDSLHDPVVRRMLNTDPNLERLRYLAILAVSTEIMVGTGSIQVDGKATFNLRQLWRVATHLGLDFERFRGAERVFRMLEGSGHVITIRDQRTGFRTQYSPTELGISQAALTLDRLRRFQGMQRSIDEEAVQPPKVYEVILNRKLFTIGTGGENTLSVDDPYMSFKHARVTYDSGRWMFEDLDSANGSWKMEPNALTRVHSAELSDNDLYQLGSIVIRFRISQTGGIL
ncbi:MAG TPA: FHA domain-containing protein [Candidatus Bathyarchaeia archaeon]|nr:FHA domain-containing protein [Candidatus Bathyarchaeia archaeon]